MGASALRRDSKTRMDSLIDCSREVISSSIAFRSCLRDFSAELVFIIRRGQHDVQKLEARDGSGTTMLKA